MTETSIAMSFTDTRLTSDGALTTLVSDRIFDSPGAAEGADYPLVMVNVQSAIPRGGNAKGNRASVRVMLLIKAIVAGNDFETAEAIYERIDAVMQDASGSAGGGTVKQVELVKQVRYPEVKTAEQYSHIGGLYQMWVSRGG